MTSELWSNVVVYWVSVAVVLLVLGFGRGPWPAERRLWHSAAALTAFSMLALAFVSFSARHEPLWNRVLLPSFVLLVALIYFAVQETRKAKRDPFGIRDKMR